jgi:hypothetical protein
MLSFLFAASMAQAAGLKLNCSITEGGSQQKVTSVAYVSSDDPHAAITHFETAYTTGFISMQRGYSVINYQVKNSKQVISFYGDALHARAMGGTFYVDGDLKDYVQTECSIQL